MEELACKLINELNEIGLNYHLYKKNEILQGAQRMAGDISTLCAYFLQGNIFGMDDEEYLCLQGYVEGVLEDYMEAVRQRDSVLMLDTLDYGLRELLNMLVGDKAEENTDD